jgi:thymidylate synthase (FAD)
VENENPWYSEKSSKARLVSVTPRAEETIAYVARVTSKDQSNPKIEGLLKYCAKNKHWSVFEQASMTVEVVTPLAISIQALRHRSFTFQQFSGRYEDQSVMKNHTEGLSAYGEMFYLPEKARLQDTKNRQNSFLVEDEQLSQKMQQLFRKVYGTCEGTYRELLELGVAKELARFCLPEGVFTRLYITGSVRSFIHYLQVREDEGVAQHEHVELSRAVRQVFADEFPVIHRSLFEKEATLKVKKSSLFRRILDYFKR